MKKFLFTLWHRIGLPFSFVVLYFQAKKTKKKFESYQEDNESFSLSDRYDYVYSMISKAFFCANIKLKIKGAENVPNKACLFVGNHKSNYDVLIILKTFSKLIKDMNVLNTTFVSKKELEKNQKIFYGAKLINAIFLDRQNLRDAIRVINEEKEILLKGEQSITVFIEGTRIDGHEFGEFKSAVLEPAYQTFCPIVPFVIYGTNNLDKEKRKSFFKYKEITIEFLKPIKYKNYIDVNKSTVAEKMKEQMLTVYNNIKENPFWKEEK